LRLFKAGTSDADGVQREISDLTEDSNPPISRMNSLQGVEANTATQLMGTGTQEVFVFEFGAAVFWGFARGEEENILSIIRMFCPTDSLVAPAEFEEAWDDMGFVTFPNVEGITVGNDVITMPDETPAKQVKGLFLPFFDCFR